MKNLQRISALVLVFLMVMSVSVLAETQAAEADFAYSASFGCFMSEDLATISIQFYGETATQGNINTECYIPVYHADTNQLVDVFYLPIQLENPFVEDSQYRYTHEIRITDPSIQNYRIKVIMLDSLETLSPEGTIQAPYSNEFTASNADYSKFVQFDGIIPYAPFYTNETTVTTEILDNVELFEGAYDAGYTENDFAPGTSISIVNQDWDLYKVQGLYCRVMINIANDGTYQMHWAEPIEGYNDTISIKPVNLETAGSPGGDAEFYYSETETELSYLPLADSVTVYQNYQTSSYSNIVPGHSDTIMEYRYVDTNVDGLYDTVYIIYEEVFVVGATYASSNRIYVNRDVMSTYMGTSFQIDSTNSYASYNLNVDFEEITVDQIVRIRPSVDGWYNHYDITVADGDSIYGEISSVNSLSGIAYYQIGDKFYRLLQSNYDNTLQVGDLISGYGFDDVIVGYERLFNANAGIIVGTGIDDTFTTEYQVKIYNQDGEAVAYTLADSVNASMPDYTATTLAQAFPVGDMIVFELNEDGEIAAYDVQTGYSYMYANVLTTDDKMTSEQNTYRLSSDKLGSYYLTEDTLIFATDAARTEITDGNLVLANNFTFLEDVTYSYSLVYNADKEAIMIVLYETEIITDDSPIILDDVYYGMVVKTNLVEGFEPIYQIQVLTPNDETVSYNLASRVNGVMPEWTTAEELSTAFPAGDIIVYQLNSNNELVLCDVGTTYTSDAANVLDSSYKMAYGSSVYSETDAALGVYAITDVTMFFNTNVSVVKRNQLIDGITYNYSVLYDENNLAKVVILETTDLLYHSEYPIVITNKETVTVDSVERTKFFGYLNGEEVELFASLDADEIVSSLDVGDIAFCSWTYDGALSNSQIYKCRILADKTEEGYVVIDNAISGAYDDTKLEVTGNYITLNTEDYGTISTAAQAKTAAENMMSVGESVSLTGFGAAGKAYSISGNTLRIINANDYPKTFDGTGERVYSTVYEDDMIYDYYIDINALAYCYNAKTDKFEVTTILNAESDVNTFDYRYGDQLENDDLIYVYQYDGETKLFLIVDVKGDN